MSSDYTARSRRFRRALLDALPEQAPGAPGPVTRLADLVQRCRFVAAGHEGIAGALDALDAVAARPSVDDALGEAALRFESPGRFRETLFFLLCIDAEASAALALMRDRDYVSGAVVPASGFPKLATDQAALIDATTYETLHGEPKRLGWMRETIATWRKAYVAVYEAQHTAYHASLRSITAEVERAGWQADALTKLNGLRGLGSPLAVAELGGFWAVQQLFPCPATPDELALSLAGEPRCPQCHYQLGDSPPAAEALRTLAAINGALQTQHSRLQLGVARLAPLAAGTPGRPLSRFLDAVRAADIEGLAAALDEGFVAFLSDVFDTPSEPDLLARLAELHPEVTEANLDEVTAVFHKLLAAEVARAGGRLVLRPEADA